MQKQTPLTYLDCCFYGAAHLDRLGRFSANPVTGKSNPGVFEEHIGGAALNAARIYSALGHSTGLVTILSDDAPGSAISAEANRHNLEVSCQRGSRSATYTALLLPNGETHVALADMAIYDEFDSGSLTKQINSVWSYFDANFSSDAIERLTERTNSKICLTTVSPSKAQRIHASLGHADLLITNRQEVSALLELSLTTAEEKIADALQSLGVTNAIITNGPAPLLLVENENIELLPVPTMDSVKDVTGAGDSFAAAVLSSLTNGRSLSEAAKFGVLVSQMVVQVSGPWHDSLKQKLSKSGQNNA